MCGSHDAESFDATVRRAFARLTREDLPRAAVVRGWPVRAPEDFERLLLDHLHDTPAAGPRPDTCLFDLVLAVELGERMLAGNLCCTKMSHRLRKTVACGKDGPDALAALLSAIRKMPSN